MPAKSDDNDKEDSSNETTGMDYDEAKGDDDDDEPMDAKDTTAATAVNKNDPTTLLAPEADAAAEDAAELEQARTERMELAAAAAAQTTNTAAATPQEKLDYLLAQSDVFAHFLAGTQNYIVVEFKYMCDEIITKLLLYIVFLDQALSPPPRRAEKVFRAEKRVD
jgi:hypothetical protein